MTPKRKARTKVVVYPDWCKGCGVCAAFCPAEVLTITPDGKAAVTNPEACVNCGFCELHCPDFAIAVVPVTDNGRKGLPPTDHAEVAGEPAADAAPGRGGLLPPDRAEGPPRKAAQPSDTSTTG